MFRELVGNLKQGSPNTQPIEETELIIAKHRSGPTGKVFVGFMPQYTRFENLETERTGGYEE